MWFSTSGILLLFLYVSPAVSKEVCPDNVIKEAIISLAHIMRDNSQKLERHEARERQLGEWIKKAVGALSKKTNGFEQLKTQLTNIEGRMAGIEQLISQRDERERIQIQKTANLIENLENRLVAEIENINSTIWEVSRSVEAARPTLNTESITSEIMAKLNDTEANLVEQIAPLKLGLNTLSNKNDADATKRSAELKSLSAKSDERERRLIEKTENLIDRLERRLVGQIEDMNSTITEAGDKCLEAIPPTSTAESMKLEISNKLEAMEAQLVGQIAKIEYDLKLKTAKYEAEVEEQTELLKKLSSERDEREEKQIDKTADLIDGFEKRLGVQMEKINSTINQAVKLISKLNETEANFVEQVAKIEFDLNESLAVKNENEAAAFLGIFSEFKNISGIIGGIEESLVKLNEDAEEEKKKEKKAGEEAIDVAAMIEDQNKSLNKVTELLKDTANRVQELPTHSDVESFHNETRTALQETKSALEAAISNGTNGVIDRVGKNIEAINKSVEALRLFLVDRTQKINNELENLVRGQNVTVSTSQEVFDIKRNLELGILQIRSDVGEKLRATGEFINGILNEKLDTVSLDIISNQSNAQAFLATNMEKEITEVWRQINLMTTTMKESATALKKLQEQNQVYVNNTNSTMDGMKTKLGDITQDVDSVKTGLELLLNQLNFTTKEFNKVKTGLSIALDDMKAAFKEVREQADDITKPGPHPVASDYQEIDNNPNVNAKSGITTSTSTPLIGGQSN